MMMFRRFLSMFVLLALAACGGGSENAGTPPFGGEGGGGSGGGTPVAADLVLVLSATSISNSGNESVTATATALDGNRNTVSGVQVTISVDNGGVVSSSGATTDEGGKVTASVGIGADRSNRTITVTATSGSLVRTTQLQVADSGGATTTPSDLVLQLGSPTILNTGAQPVTATVTALDARRNVLPGASVIITVDNGATALVSGPITDDMGVITAEIGTGGNPTNRIINITATSGSITRTAALQVTNTPTTTGPVAADLSIVLSAATLSNDGSSAVTATVTSVDANRNALGGIPVTVSVNNGAVATVSGPTTDARGLVTAQVGIGADRSNRSITVTADSGTLSRTATFQVVGAKLTATPLPAVIVPGAAGKVEFRLIDVNSNPMSGQTIVVNGVNAVEVSGTTDINGNYSYAYAAPVGGGTLDIRATAGGVSVTQTVLVQSGTGTIPPAGTEVLSASLAASPSVVSVNSGSTSNRSELRALFLGAGNAPVQNVRVRFDLAGDANNIGGTLTSGTSVIYSDANGVATTAYVPGTRFSPTDGLTVRACWSPTDFAAGTCPNEAMASLTVISEALSVSISTNALIEIGPTGLDYIKKYLVQVNDSSGNAKAGVQISPSIDLLRYFKGEWVPGLDKWIKVQRASCDNEDLNRNGVLEVYSNGAIEDANRTNRLEPRKADLNISFVGSSTTNSDGQAVLKITYGQSLASWLEFNILVAASGVAGTEGRTSYQGVLPVLAAAVSNLAVEPAFRLGPYGLLASPVLSTTNPERQTGLLCTDPN